MSVADLFKSDLRSLIILLLTLCWASVSFAQDLEPRRWSQMPTGLNFVGVGYGYVNGDIFFDPLLLIEEATFEMHRTALFYMRSTSI